MHFGKVTYKLLTYLSNQIGKKNFLFEDFELNLR